MNICSVDNCDKKVLHRGMCRKHWELDIKANKIGTRSRYAENEIEYLEDGAYLSLYDSRGNVVAKAIVDLEDVERVRKHVWSLKVCTHKLNYAINTKVGRLHHFIMNTKERLDHIDTNGLNNRKNNLRFAQQISNAKNMSISIRNTSGAKGVSWNKHCYAFEAYIFVENKKKLLGYFQDIVLAAIAYNEAAVEFYKEFANLNDIELLKNKIAKGEIDTKTKEIYEAKGSITDKPWFI